MPFVEVDGAKIYYEVDGTSEPLLLCHGVRGSSRNWALLRPHLRDNFKLIMPDSRGHGRSTELSEPSTMNLYSKDMIALLDHLELSQCIMAGHSMGGFIVQQIALDAPHLVKALILINTAPMVDVEGALAQIELGKLAYGLEPKEAVLKLLEFEFHDPEKIRNTPGLLDHLIHQAKESQRLANSHGSAQGACAKFNIQDRVKEIQAPTFVICCSEDKTFPCRWSDFYAKNLDKVTTKVINKSSHSVQFEQPQELARAIIEFINTL